MAFLRNVALQTYNSNIFFNFFGGFSPALNSLFTHDNIQELPHQLQNPIRPNHPTPSYHLLTLSSTTELMLSHRKSISRLINLNINSLTHIIENESTDFAGHQDFVHALQLEQEEEWELDDIKTVVSVNFDTEGDEENSQNSTYEDSVIVFGSESDCSEVEEDFY